MKTQTCRPKARRRNGFFVPAFENIINEVMHTPLKDFQAEATPKFTKPKANVQQSEDGYTLQLALPGFSKKDVEIKIDKDVLFISSTRENETKVDFRLREFNYGNFNRQFRLNDTIDRESIEASFENGILTITLAKIKPEPAKTIKIS